MQHESKFSIFTSKKLVVLGGLFCIWFIECMFEQGQTQTFNKSFEAIYEVPKQVS